MLTSELRPVTWGEVVGQKINVQILKAIAKNPEKAPRSIILEGAYGSGKTTLARILARELNGIKDRNYDLEMAPFYHEYDSSVVGNVERIRELRDTFGVGAMGYYQVIVFDEIHVSSNQAQTALLKVIEDVQEKVFFIFATTHIQKVIPTIRSRSLELVFNPAFYNEIIEHLDRVSEKLGISIPDDVKSAIALRSRGHMRDVNMLLDKYILVGKEVFRESIKFSTDLFCDFFMCVLEDNKEYIMRYLNELSEVPIRDLKDDFSNFILLCMKEFTGIGSGNERIKDLVKHLGGDLLKIVQNYYSAWMKNVFTSEVDFLAGMLVLYNFLRKGTGGDQVRDVRTTMRDRAVRR